jgi:hypothetical protein
MSEYRRLLTTDCAGVSISSPIASACCACAGVCIVRFDVACRQPSLQNSSKHVPGNTIARLIDPFGGGGRCWLKSMRQFEWISSQVAVGQGQRSQPGHESGGRAIWTVNAVDHGGVTFRSGRPHCSQRRGQRKRRSRKGRLLLVDGPNG